MRAFAAVFLVSPVILSACGGSTTSNNVTSYETLRTSMAVPFDAEVTAGTATALSATPPENSASMTGIFRAYVTTISDVDSIAGQMDMNANFAAGTVSGTMTNLIEVDSANFGTDIAGSVSYSGAINVGPVNNDDITATGNGSFTGTDGRLYTVSTTLDGDFYRRPSTQLGAAGTIAATATSGSTIHLANGAYIVSE